MEKRNIGKVYLGTVSKSVPFYEPPSRKISADIINEAKATISGFSKLDSCSLTNVKPIFTERPFTPKDQNRTLFGKKSIKKDRPPSSFSLRYLQDQTEFNIPSTLLESNFEKPTEPKNFDKTVIMGSDQSLEFNESRIFNLQVKHEVHPRKLTLPSLESTNHPDKNWKKSYSLDSDYKNSSIDLHRNLYSNSPLEKSIFSERFGFSERTIDNKIRKSSASSPILLQPQNLDRIFGNKQIVENSEMLFEKTGYLNIKINTNNNNKIIESSAIPISTEIMESQKVRVHTVEEIIEMINNETNGIKNNDTIVNLLEMMYRRLKEDNKDKMNYKINSKLKLRILKCLYRHVESENQKILINIAKILLFLKVTGHNLSGVCKLIFKISKNGENDNLFLEANILELFLDSLGRSSPLEDAEACIYGYGAIKFLTTNPKILENVLNLGILPLMVLHMKMINNAKIENIHLQDQTSNVLFQLTGALRNLASFEDKRNHFISCEAISQLCTSLKLFSDDLDVISIISRNLSHLSSQEKCCDKISNCDLFFSTAIEIFDKYTGNEEVVVRLAYTLGNAAAKNDVARIKLYRVRNCIRVLMKLWKLYFDLTLKHCSLKCDNNDKDRENSTEDVMIKLIRIIANLAMNSEIGREISQTFGVQLIEEILKILISNPFKNNEELVLSVLTTLNNLTYYYISDIEKDIFLTKEVEIMDALKEYINCKNKEHKLEALRILGNLSRSKLARNYILRNELIDILMDFLKEDDLELLETTIGIFINLMFDSAGKEVFKNKDGIDKLMEILKNHGQEDWNLSTMICQTIWNYCIDSVDFYELISGTDLEKLMKLLADRLDEDKLFGIKDIARSDDICFSAEFLAWEEFAFIATNLLEKIEHFLDVIDDTDYSKSVRSDNKKDSSTSIIDVVDSSTNLSFSSW